MTDPLEHALATIVGPAHVLTDDDQRAGYETDWTRRWHGHARLVVRPANTAEVSAVLAACKEARVAVVTQGGNTGLVGGSIPHGGEALLSLRRLTELGPVDSIAREVVAGAGVTAATLNAHAAPHGLRLGVDLASRDSATIGGMVATNAGGIHVLRHGMMRAQVAGIEFVLANGRVVDRLHGVRRDNTGYDLAGLLTGSEGTLGVITRVRLRLAPVYDYSAVALIGLPTVEAALELTAAVRGEVPSLQAAEVFLSDGLALVCRHAGLPAPFAESCAVYVLFEAADRREPTVDLAGAVERAEGANLVAFATEPRERARLWAYRERHTEAVNAEGVPHKLDVALPLPRLAEFVARLPEATAAVQPAPRAILFGHLADGNLHVNLLDLDPEDERADEAVLRLVAALAGSISAEHGVGVAKREWMHLTRSPADIAAMRAIKHALDPAGTLNPGVLFG